MSDFDYLMWLGKFSPTVDKSCLKGYVDGIETYFDSDELRDAAAQFIQAADWLDEQEENELPKGE